MRRHGAAPDRASDATVEWGWLPALSLVSAIGMLLLAFADTGARSGAAWAEPLYWVALLSVWVPISGRLVAARSPSRRELLGLVVVLATSLYLVKLLHSPVSFSLHDELGHWRSADDIGRSGHLFAENPVVRSYPLYPGILIVTDALAKIGGMSIFAAGVVVVAVARLVMTLALFLVLERISRSARFAAIGSMIYMANPSYLYFDAQFAYESFALPLAALALCLVVIERPAERWQERWAWRALIGIVLTATVISHHLTSYAVLALLLSWVVLDRWLHYDRRRVAIAPRPLAVTGALIAMIAIWIVLVARLTFVYLEPVLSNAVAELVQLGVREESTGREVFRAPTGQVDPAWERLVGVASVALILLGTAVTLWHLRRPIWARRIEPVPLVLIGAALLYPGTMALRLTTSGQETSDRASAFIFLGSAFVLATVAAARQPGGSGQPSARRARRGYLWRGRVTTGILVASLTILFVGQITVAWSRAARKPGPYLVVADPRSIEPQGIEAARWVGMNLEPGNAIITDRINGLLMAAYGRQDPRALQRSAVLLLFSPALTAGGLETIRELDIRYVVVDRRVTTGLPLRGFYMTSEEPDAYGHLQPIDPASLAKFDAIPGVDRVFDSGDIIIYDVSALDDQPSLDD